MMIRNGDRVENIRDARTGTATSEITYRRNAGRSHKQIQVRWDDGGEWTILLRNLRPETTGHHPAETDDEAAYYAAMADRAAGRDGA